MKMFTIPLGTVGKLIKLMPGKDAEVVDWTTRKELVFTGSLIDPVVVANMANAASKKPLAVRMAEQGYALFGGDTGGDRNAVYVLAIPYKDVKVS